MNCGRFPHDSTAKSRRFILKSATDLDVFLEVQSILCVEESYATSREELRELADSLEELIRAQMSTFLDTNDRNAGLDLIHGVQCRILRLTGALRVCLYEVILRELKRIEEDWTFIVAEANFVSRCAEIEQLFERGLRWSAARLAALLIIELRRETALRPLLDEANKKFGKVPEVMRAFEEC